MLPVIAMLSSCAAWRSEQTPKMGKLSDSIFQDVKPINISLSLNLYEVYKDGELIQDKNLTSLQTEILSKIQKIYGENKIFNVVDTDSPSRELSIEISVTRTIESSLFRSFLTILSLYLIPKRTNEEIIVTTKFIDKKGMLVGMVEKKEIVEVWHQLFLIFALPFNIPSSVNSETLLDLNRATIYDAFSDGFFIDLNH